MFRSQKAGIAVADQTAEQVEPVEAEPPAEAEPGAAEPEQVEAEPGAADPPGDPGGEAAVPEVAPYAAQEAEPQIRTVDEPAPWLPPGLRAWSPVQDMKKELRLMGAPIWGTKDILFGSE